MTNIILASDSYKHSHYLQYPEGTKYVSSYIEARGGPSDGKMQFMGIQAFIQDYLTKPITHADIEEAEALMGLHGLTFNRLGWERIVNVHGGLLPIHITALPEGIFVPRGTPLVQVHNTDPELPWLTSFIETALLRSIWYPSSVATLSALTKVVISAACNYSSDDPAAQLPFKLHDFGGRGVSSSESAGLGTMAHLVNFLGTDTIEGLMAVRRIYDDPEICAGFSIPASEHSTITAWGRYDEAGAYANMIDQFGEGMFSVVSDSYDLFNALENIYGDELKDKILQMKGKLVVRPDSGNPVLVPIRTLEILWDKFGGTVNSKGFKVLNSKIGVIQGDGMNFESITQLVFAMMRGCWSMDNIAFGMGGGLLQGHKRDDLNFAMKANAIDLGYGWADLQKNPATDPTKTSKAGRQTVIETEDGIIAVREDACEGLKSCNLLKTVYLDGVTFKKSFSELRIYAGEQVAREVRAISPFITAATSHVQAVA